MIKSLKLFAACVESLRVAEKEFQKNPTPFNNRIVESLQNKVDGWLVWIHSKEDDELRQGVPPFIGRLPTPRHKILDHNIMEQLKENHPAEELEKFLNNLNGL